MRDLTINRFLDSSGKVVRWPAKQRDKLLIMQYLANKFDPTNTYQEREVNEILNQWHTFGDWAMLRRALVDHGSLTRDRDGTEYRRIGE